MVHGSRYRVPLRRRRQQKTDYQARKGFVVSGKPRLVARSSLKNTVAQIIIAKPHGDEVVAAAHTHELAKKYSWKGATGNIPAAYLTGLLCGLKAKKNGVSGAILDLGLVSPVKGSKVFATMSGVVDAGVEIPHSQEKIVKDRQVGYHIQDYAEGLGAPEEYAPKFSSSVAKGLNMLKFSDHFFEVRAAILTAFGLPVPKPETRTAKPKKPEPKKPEVKKAEAKPAASEAKPQAKPEVTTAKAPEVQVLDVTVVKSEEKTEAKAPKTIEAKPTAAPVPESEKTEAVVKEKPKAKAAVKPKAEKAEAKAKSAAKKAVPAKKKSEKAGETAEEPEVKLKRTRKKPEAEEASAKPARKTGGKKA